MTMSPRAHLWLDIPTGCRFETSVVSANEIRIVLGDPSADGHTLDLSREALHRLHTVTGDTLRDLDSGAWLATTTARVSEPGSTDAPLVG